MRKKDRKRKGKGWRDVTEVKVFNINIKVEMRSRKPIGKIRTFTRYDKFMDVIKTKAFIGCSTIKTPFGRGIRCMNGKTYKNNHKNEEKTINSNIAAFELLARRNSVSSLFFFYFILIRSGSNWTLLLPIGQTLFLSNKILSFIVLVYWMEWILYLNKI